MDNLNTVLNLDLNSISLFFIDEEKLLAFKSEDYYTQSNFYFWLSKKSYELEKEKKTDELAYCHYLISYYIFIILTPLCYEELAFTHSLKATKLSSDIKYKEWLLIFATLPHNFMKVYDILKISEEILEIKPESSIANTIIQMY